MNLPRWGILLIDMVITVIAILAAYLLRFNFDIPSIEFKFIKIAVPLILFIRTVSFLIFKTYAGIIFHTSIEDAQRIFIAVTSGTLFFTVSTIVGAQFLGYHIIPYSIIIIDYFVTIFLMLALRAFVKVLYLEMRNLRKDKKNIIIYGAGSAGITAKKALDRDMGSNYSINAFVDDKEGLNKKRLLGIEIFPSQQLERLLISSQPHMLLLSTDDISPTKKQSIVELCLQYNVKVLNVPPMDKWINGELSFHQIKEIRIEDLLERDPIQLDLKVIEQQVSNKVILVTGAAGSIGSELARQLTRFHPKKLILLDQAETPLHELDLELANLYQFCNYEMVLADVRNTERMHKIFQTFQPEIIYHAAAYKHVPMIELNPSEAILTNVKGTSIMANLAVQYHTKCFVLVSTDKAVNPTSIMGASKRIAEIYVQALQKKLGTSNGTTRFITTRFGNVLGSNGSVIPLFKKQIERGGPITVTHPEITRYFMTIPEACQLVLDAGAMSKGGEIFVFDMGKSIKIVDLAKKMIRLSGLEEGNDIHIVFTGLRPGEKLYEELLNQKETNLPTHNPKITIAKVREYDFETIANYVNQLLTLFKQQDNEQLVRLLKEIIPEYKSNNSIYEKLDE